MLKLDLHCDHIKRCGLWRKWRHCECQLPQKGFFVKGGCRKGTPRPLVRLIAFPLLSGEDACHPRSRKQTHETLMLWCLWPWSSQSLEQCANTFWWFYETIYGHFVIAAWQELTCPMVCEEEWREIIELPVLILCIKYLINSCISNTAIISSLKIIFIHKICRKTQW